MGCCLDKQSQSDNIEEQALNQNNTNHKSYVDHTPSNSTRKKENSQSTNQTDLQKLQYQQQNKNKENLNQPVQTYVQQRQFSIYMRKEILQHQQFLDKLGKFQINFNKILSLNESVYCQQLLYIYLQNEDEQLEKIRENLSYLQQKSKSIQFFIVNPVEEEQSNQYDSSDLDSLNIELQKLNIDVLDYQGHYVKNDLDIYLDNDTFQYLLQNFSRQ